MDVSNASNCVWSIERTAALINMYKLHACLYDPKSVAYKNKAMRHEIWEYLGKRIGTTGAEVSKKVRGLRTQYAREKAKIVQKANEGLTHKSAWVHYNSLNFLYDFTSSRSSKFNSNSWSGYNQETDLSQEDDEEEIGEIVNPNAFVIREVKPEYDDEDCVVIPDKPQSPSISNEMAVKHHQQQESFTEKKATKRKYSSPSPQLPQPTVTSSTRDPVVRGSNERAPVKLVEEEARSNDDDDEIFAKYITSELRQIRDSHTKRVVKHKIQNIIFEAHCATRKTS